MSTKRCRRGLPTAPPCSKGTVGVVALHHGRDFIGIELNSAYVQLAEERIAAGSHKLGAV